LSYLFSPKPLVLALTTVFCALPGLAFAASPLSMGEGNVCTAPQRPKNFVKPVQSSGEANPGTDVTRVVADDVNGQSQVQVHAKGNVIIERNDVTLNSDWADYDQQTQIIKAGDHFTLDNGQGRVTGEHVTYDMAKSTGIGDAGRFEMEKDNRRLQGVGNEIQMGGKNRYRLQSAKFNTCNPGDDSWYIRSGSIDLDYDKNVGVARNATLVFGGVPLFYTPWIDFPLNGSRKSGFLAPTIKGGSDGFELMTPYYLNLAPNYDATIRPHFISSRGIQLGGDFRYLQPKYQGQLSADWVPSDQKSSHKNRAEIDFTHTQQLAKGLTGGIDYHQVSDDDYRRDFWHGDSGSVNLNRQAWLNYHQDLWGGTFDGNLMVQKYQTLASTSGYKDQPYSRLPHLSATWNRYFGNHYTVNVYAEATHFEGRQTGHKDWLYKYPNGTRLLLLPAFTADYANSWGYVRPKLSFHATHYDMSRQNNQDSRSMDRAVPILSVDSGVTFERLWKTRRLHKGFIQTLEPRLFYTYIPKRNQDDMPLFDTAENSFTYDQLFRENRYSGQDRINAANFLTTALQSRVYDSTSGIERFAAGIGQRFYFSDDNVKLNDNTPKNKERKRSDIVAFGRAALSNHITAESKWHYNQDLKTSESYNFGIRYTPKPGKTVSVRYKYGRDENLYDDVYGKMRAIDVGVQWPLTRNYYLVARQNYDITHSTTLNQTVGFEYQSPCHCWSAGLVGTRYTDDYQKRKTAVLFQLQLRDLTGVGNGPLNQLSSQIPGYSNTYEVKH
jgi:LPS-assembly protein